MRICGGRKTSGLFLCVAVLLTGLFAVRPVDAQANNPREMPNPGRGKLDIPNGTVLPVRLYHGFSSQTAKPGQAVRARVMQDVPLPDGSKIPEGAKISGTILSVQRATNSAAGKISFRFDALAIHKAIIAVGTSLRALAGFMEVQAAQTPEFSPGFGTPYAWATTQQIGGDEVYGVGGPVTNRWSERVGTAVDGGVLVHVRAQPSEKCRGALDAEDRLQALWVFSADACGVYGIEGVSIAHAGRGEPLGEIMLSAARGDVRIRGASAMLLRVIR